MRRAIQSCPDLSKASFVDLGCGKGLPLVVATEYPFQRVLGVELAPELCVVARHNAERLKTLHPERTPIEIVEGISSPAICLRAT
jgi:tRNA1(Val) A37 N6-methylase TrmN6